MRSRCEVTSYVKDGPKWPRQLRELRKRSLLSHPNLLWDMSYLLFLCSWFPKALHPCFLPLFAFWVPNSKGIFTSSNLKYGHQMVGVWQLHPKTSCMYLLHFFEGDYCSDVGGWLVTCTKPQEAFHITSTMQLNYVRLTILKCPLIVHVTVWFKSAINTLFGMAYLIYAEQSARRIIALIPGFHT